MIGGEVILVFVVMIGDGLILVFVMTGDGLKVTLFEMLLGLGDEVNELVSVDCIVGIFVSGLDVGCLLGCSVTGELDGCKRRYTQERGI